MPYGKTRVNTSGRLLAILLLSLALLMGCETSDQDNSVERDKKEAPVQAAKKESQGSNDPAETSEVEVTESTGEDQAEQAHQELLTKYDASEIPEPTPPEESYQQRLAEYGEDYEECGAEVEVSDRKCEKPASLGDRELKENINIQLILDASGSMQGEVGGERKMDVAKRVLTGFVGTLPDEANVSLRVYGHVGSSSKAARAESCAASELILPFQKLDQRKFTEAINSFEPRGWTPVAGSLEKARQNFSDFDPETNSNFVYLVSDGVETCGGNPVAAAKQLAAEDIKAEVNIVGFDVDPAAARQLREAAKSGGGSYQDASNAAEMEEVFRENYNWEEWTAYYNCVWDKAHGDYNETWDVEHGNYNCLWDKSHGEYNAIWDDAHGRYNEIWDGEHALYNAIYDEVSGNSNYGELDSEILDLARERRDDRVDAAREERDYSVKQAREKRDGIIEPARERRDEVVDEAREKRDEAVEGAREERDKNIDD